MKKVTKLLVLSALTLTCACAKSPSSIAPMAVSSSEYTGLSCRQLVAEQSSVSAKLAEASERQNDAQAADAVGVFLVLIPVSALTGDAEAEVAQYKGEKIAVERALAHNRCS